MIELPNGNYAALAKERFGLPINDFPISYDDPMIRANVAVNTDLIFEFEPDGTVVHAFQLGPEFDPTRLSWDSLNSSFLDGRLDWTHANGMDYDPIDDAYWVTFRHQDAVVKFGRTDGKMQAIIGNHDNWSATHTSMLFTPDASVEWQYHQHSPDLHPDGGKIIVFDNGNMRTSPWVVPVLIPDDEPTEIRSRIVEYGFDESDMSITQNWAFEPPDGTTGFPAIGGARYLDNGNVLATFGLVVAKNGVLIQDQGQGFEASHLLEFDPDNANEVVMDLYMYTDNAVFPDGWQTYRAERITSPYPVGYLLSE
jgi:hypothetical protein